MDEVEPIECNLPFSRLPQCACDLGRGPAPTRQQMKIKMMECRLKDGPCAPGYCERHPEACIPETINQT